MLAQGMADKLKGSETLAKHSFVSKENYAATLSMAIKELENGFQDCQKNHPFSGLSEAQFAVNINTLLVKFQIEYSMTCNQKSDHVFLPDFHKPLFPEKIIFHFTVKSCSCHLYLAVCTFVNNYYQG